MKASVVLLVALVLFAGGYLLLRSKYYPMFAPSDIRIEYFVDDDGRIVKMYSYIETPVRGKVLHGECWEFKWETGYRRLDRYKFGEIIHTEQILDKSYPKPGAPRPIE